MTNEVLDVLKFGWAVDLKVMTDEIGINNTTWKVGDSAWLTRYTLDDVDRVSLEMNLLEHLNDKHVADSSGLKVTEIIKTRQGNKIYKYGKYLWRLSKHMDGEMPSPEDASLYPIISKGLGDFHRILREVPLSFAVTNNQLIQAVERYVYQFLNNSQEINHKSVINDTESENYILIYDAAQRLSKNFEKIQKLPVQLIHGDFTHPNLRINKDHSKLTGVLDLEFCSVDPAIFDLASVVLTLFTRSKLRDPLKLYKEIIITYEDRGGEVEPDLLEVAILAKKLDSYFYHRERLLNGRGSVDTYLRQIEQLKLVLSIFDR
ncbi:phosphotransferase [Paenibacillus sp. FSL H8-0537]|uniref:phosphotransferase n=1 Tax=Paenibacillus sp. FSL H8-0537 TaxID=2921399 RepID=UPI0031016EFE